MFTAVCSHLQRTAPARHRRRHVHCAGMGVPVLKNTASERPCPLRSSLRQRYFAAVCRGLQSLRARARADSAQELGHRAQGCTDNAHGHAHRRLYPHALKALAEVVILSTGTSVPAQWTRRRRWPMGRRVCEQVLEATQLKNQGIVLKAAHNPHGHAHGQLYRRALSTC